jgi:hypothetical protein
VRGENIEERGEGRKKLKKKWMGRWYRRAEGELNFLDRAGPNQTISQVSATC